MDSLPALRFCAEVLAGRVADDAEHRWLWAIRQKVLAWSINRQTHAPGQSDIPASAAATPIPPGEQQRLLATHPLLRLPELRSIPALCSVTSRSGTISRRVERYVDSCNARRA